MDRKKLIRLLALFLMVMLLFTVLSRAADSAGIAMVQTESVQSMTIDHSVKGSGKVEQNLEMAVSTLADQTVKSILVNEGDIVKKGESLFEINMDVLKEKILLKKQEIEKLTLQNKDSKSKSEAESEKKESTKIRAAQDYENAVNKGDYEIAKAAQAVDAARQKLDEYRRSQKPSGDGDSMVSSQLEQAVKEKESVYQEAVKAKELLENKIEREVNQLLDEAEGSMEETTPETKAVDYGEAEQRIRKKYKKELAEAEKTQMNAGADRDEARDALTSYQQEQATVTEKGNGEEEQQLIADLDTKQQAYQDAVEAKDQSILEARRGIEDAQAGEGSDSSAKINSLDKEVLQMQLEKLKQLQSDKGQILAPADGMVTKIAVTTGDKTTEGTAVLMADLSGGVRFTAQIPKSQEKYIARNDTVTLKPSGNKGEIMDQKVESVKVNEADGEMLDVNVLLPGNLLEIGTASDFEVVRTSSNYGCCIPIQGLRTENGHDFVYIVQESESVLGMETIARRVEVRVMDKNDKYAALEEGSLTSDQKVITDSNKSISEGSRVRETES